MDSPSTSMDSTAPRRDPALDYSSVLANSNGDDRVVDPRAMELLLAEELKQLSFQDRTHILEEMHGCRSMAKEETPQIIEEGLTRLEMEIQKIPDNRKTAYNGGVVLGSTFVFHRDVRLKFLRAELFDARKAAHRLIQYLDIAVDHFGIQAAMRPIMLADLTPTEQVVLSLGEVQLLPSRDRMGRRIALSVGAYGDGITTSCRVRFTFDY
jgi:hypothetical protein